jgi:hypothetical protein
LVHRQTVLLTDNAGQAVRDLTSARVGLVSSGLVANQNQELGFTSALIVRDPDGHAVEIEQK